MLNEKKIDMCMMLSLFNQYGLSDLIKDQNLNLEEKLVRKVKEIKEVDLIIEELFKTSEVVDFD